MAKKAKHKIQLVEGIDPGLFGQKYSSRDYRYEESWVRISLTVLSQLLLLRI